MRTRRIAPRIVTLAVVVMAIGAFSAAHPAGAHVPGLVLSGYGTPSIDGVLSPGEWSSAGRHAFAAAVPPNDGGGTTPATLLVMNDDDNLYIALEVVRSGLPRGSFSVEFDNDHDGLLFEEGDDFFVANTGLAFSDGFRSQQPPCPPSVVCGFLDTQAGGSNDGRSVGSGNGTVHVYEVEHPLDSADDLHDFSLGPGSVVGFHAWIRLFSLEPSCNFGPLCTADTRVPPFGVGDIVVSDGSDTTAPDTTITAGPEDGSLTNESSARFTFAGSDETTSPAALAFECSFDGAPFTACTSPAEHGGLADGEHTFAVRAIDAAGNRDASPTRRTWTVDTTAPSIALSASPNVLWPPNHRLVPVSVHVSADDRSGIAAVFLASATSSEPDDGPGDGDTSEDIQGALVGTLDTEVLLRAERAGSGTGRTYTLLYEAVDRAGNSAFATANVSVPLSQTMPVALISGRK